MKSKQELTWDETYYSDLLFSIYPKFYNYILEYLKA